MGFADPVNYIVVGFDGDYAMLRNESEPDAPLTAALIQECAKNGLLIENAGTYGNVIRFLAPLVITDEQLEAGLDIMEKALVKCMGEE